MASPTSPISPKQQQHGGTHGPDQLVVNKKQTEEKSEEKQPVEATDGGTGDGHGELNHFPKQAAYVSKYVRSSKMY